MGRCPKQQVAGCCLVVVSVCMYLGSLGALAGTSDGALSMRGIGCLWGRMRVEAIRCRLITSSVPVSGEGSVGLSRDVEI